MFIWLQFMCIWSQLFFVFVFIFDAFFYAGSQPCRHGGGNSYNGTHQSTPGIKGSVRSVRTSQNTFVRDTALLERCEIFYCFVGNGGDELKVLMLWWMWLIRIRIRISSQTFLAHSALVSYLTPILFIHLITFHRYWGQGWFFVHRWIFLYKKMSIFNAFK